MIQLFRRSSLTLSSIVLIILTRKKRTLSTAWKQSRTIFVKNFARTRPEIIDERARSHDQGRTGGGKKKNAFDATNMAILQMNAR